jgi:hypothetical protein
MDNAAGTVLVKLLSSFHEDLRQRELIEVTSRLLSVPFGGIVTKQACSAS